MTPRLLSLAFVAAAALTPAQLDKSLGVLVTSDGVGCLMIRNPSLRPGAPITLLHGLFDDTKAKTPVQLSVGPKAASDCDKRHGGIGEKAVSFYSVAIQSSMKADPPNAVVYVGGNAGPTPFGWLLDGAPAAVRTCVGNEGINATIWSGKPLASTRLWRFYYYLGADSEPNCKSGDSD